MCGIFGYFNQKAETLSDQSMKSMGLAISHRGPDGSGFYNQKGRGLGNQRLSIIDVEGGDQPFISDDNNVVVVQNGEIYNYVELREHYKKRGYSFKTESDTEVILASYLFDGLNALKSLNGMFAIGIYDKRLDQVFVVRDRVGIKPLYWTQQGHDVFFASEIKSLLPFVKERNFDMKSLGLLFRLGYIPPPTTLFKNIYSLKPGEILKLSNNNIETKAWWNIENSLNDRVLSFDEAVDQTNELLDDSIRIRMRADVDFGAFLSGGVDSSLIVSKMKDKIQGLTKTFTISFANTEFDESSHASLASKTIGTDHYVRPVDKSIIKHWPKFIYHCDQPHADMSFIPTYAISELASEHVKMVLTGDGADELFSGYSKYKNLNITDQTTTQDIAFQYINQNQLTTLQEMDQLTSQRVLNNQHDPLQELTEQVLMASSKSTDVLNRYLILDFHLLMAGNNFVKPDRMGMAASIEARTPFMDYRLIEQAFSYNSSIKMKDGHSKAILKELLKRTFPKEFVDRKKQMFTVPITSWMPEEGLAPLLVRCLEHSPFVKELLNKESMENILEEHSKNTLNHLRVMRTIISLSLWEQMFLEKKSWQEAELLFDH